MPSDKVIVAGRRHWLPALAKMKKCELRLLFPLHRDRKLVVKAFVGRKLKVLRVGVHWERVVGCHFRKGDFLAIKKREMRFLRGVSRKKRSLMRHSFFVRFKLASHLVLRGRAGVVCLDKVPDRSQFDRGVLDCIDVRELLSVCIGCRRLAPWARSHLGLECQSAARCSWWCLFGKEQWGL